MRGRFRDVRGFCSIFWLEVKALARSKTLAMLAFVTVSWMCAFPRIATGDGTADGARELWIHYSLGGAFVLLVVALLASAAGAVAHERESNRLSLTVVRPVRYASVVLARACALVAAGAAVLALDCAVLPFSARTGWSRVCRHVAAPALPSVREEARRTLDAFMKDPSTPEAVRKAKPAAVLSLLENRIADNYLVVRTNATARWRFMLPRGVTEDLGVRVRLSGHFGVRREVDGVFRLGDLEGTVSNLTQTLQTVPLRLPGGDRTAAVSPEPASDVRELSFENRGRETVMLRPRKDLELLWPADAFGWNLFRCYLELVGILALVVSFGLFLSVSLSRPVALFVAMVTLAVGEMSPSVIERNPNELGAGTVDRIGLVMTRLAAEITRPVSVLEPISRLSADTCVEWREVVRVVLFGLLLLPVLFALLSGWVLPRKSS